MSIGIVPLLLWLGLASLGLALAVLLVTRWGVSRPLFKCTVLSLLAHVLLAAYAATVQIAYYVPRNGEETFHFSSFDVLTSGDGLGEGEGYGDGGDYSAEPVHSPADPPPIAAEEQKPPDSIEQPEAIPEKPEASLTQAPEPPVPPDSVEDKKVERPQLAIDDIGDVPKVVDNTPEIEVAAIVPISRSAGSASVQSRPQTQTKTQTPSAQTTAMPAIYSLRTAEDRAGVAQRHGATSETEAAVRAALKWLADNQTKGGNWDSRATGGGKEQFVLARDRQNAGIDADTGMTGLALLAMLAAGHTHLRGDYEENVRRGLEYLLRTQGGDGNLGGPATAFSRMYCHAIATIALCEALGMTGDSRLLEPAKRAISYTTSSQNKTTGGWRYVPGDPGDTSQLGWQWMALKSAELAGIPIPDKTRQGAIKYLQGVASGQYGGLAAYRPSEPPSRTMTAEALVCWQFLGMARENPAGDEAGDYILGELPTGKGQTNMYYWYYATLSTYQLQGKHWETWNQAVRKTLVESQRKTGPSAGSWDTDDVWGGYGGRVFTTALATLILEVYYRFLPLYALDMTTKSK
jgi:hypothetical protein